MKIHFLNMEPTPKNSFGLEFAKREFWIFLKYSFIVDYKLN